MLKKTLCVLSLLCLSTIMPAQAQETIVLEDVSVDKIKNAITTVSTNSGMTAVAGADNELIFEQKYNGTLNWGSDAKTRHIYRLVEQEGEKLELSLELQRITGEGTPSEKISVLSWEQQKKYPKQYRSEVEEEAAYTLECLRQIKLGFNGGYWIGFTPAADITDEHVLVEEVAENGPSNKAGLQAGDVIVAINGKKIEKMSYVYFDAMLNRTNIDGTPLQLTVERGMEKLKLTIEPVYVSSSLGVTDRDIEAADAQYANRQEPAIPMPTEEEIAAAQAAQAEQEASAKAEAIK